MWPTPRISLSSPNFVLGQRAETDVRASLLFPSVGLTPMDRSWLRLGLWCSRTISMWVPGTQLLSSYAEESSDMVQAGWPESGAGNLMLRSVVPKSSWCGVQRRKGRKDRPSKPSQAWVGYHCWGSELVRVHPIVGALLLETLFISSFSLFSF